MHVCVMCVTLQRRYSRNMDGILYLRRCTRCFGIPFLPVLLLRMPVGWVRLDQVHVLTTNGLVVIYMRFFFLFFSRFFIVDFFGVYLAKVPYLEDFLSLSPSWDVGCGEIRALRSFTFRNLGHSREKYLSPSVSFLLA